MKIIQQNNILYKFNKHGKKQRVIKIKCSYCKNTIYKDFRKSRRGKYSYCLGTNCKRLHQYKYKDSKGSKIMQLIDTPNFNYLVGLIASDGHIQYPGSSPSVTKYGCRIELHERDLELLKNIKTKFGGYLNKGNSKKCSLYHWDIFNRDFIIFLRDIVGLTNNKSKTLDINRFWFNNLEKNSKSSFIRGIVDGDGCVCFTKNKFISICSYSPKFMIFLKEYFNTHKYKMSTYGKELKFFGRNALPAFKDIFVNDKKSLFMKRKWEKWLLLYEYYINAKPYNYNYIRS